MDEHFTEPSQLVDDPSFRQYVRQSDPAAVRLWDAWCERHPELSELVREARVMVQLLDSTPRYTLAREQVEKEVADIRARLHGEVPPSLVVSESAGIQRWIRPAYWAAACVLLVAAFGVWYAQPTWPTAPTEALRTNPALAPSSQTAPVATYQTPYGERRSVTLPDGSVVTLNAHSTLTTIAWTENRREVRLEGEAFFRVSKKTQAGRPVKFVVRAGLVAVEVLGTRFNVSTRHQRVTVALEEGDIRLKVLDPQRPDTDGVRMLDMVPGDRVELTNQQLITLSRSAKPDDYAAWTEGELVFDDTPLSEVAALIHDNYGYEVVFDTPELADRRLTARLPDPSLDMLLKALSKAFSLSVTRSEKTIRITQDK